MPPRHPNLPLGTSKSRKRGVWPQARRSLRLGPLLVRLAEAGGHNGSRGRICAADGLNLQAVLSRIDTEPAHQTYEFAARYCAEIVRDTGIVALRRAERRRLFWDQVDVEAELLGAAAESRYSSRPVQAIEAAICRRRQAWSCRTSCPCVPGRTTD